MLSKEQRHRMDHISYRNGMRNIVYIAGLARGITAKGGWIQQTRNENHMIPFVVDEGSVVPSWVRDRSVVKVVGRISGAMLPRENEADPAGVRQRVAVLRAIHFELPSVLEMPPEEAWTMSIPKRAPASDARPAEGMVGVPNSRNSNRVEVAGFVAGVMLRRSGVPGSDGYQQNGCIHVLVQQTSDPAEAVPVRIYGRLSAEYEKKIRLGSPVYVPLGEMRVDAKEVGEPDADGIAPVRKVPYVRSSSLHVATPDQIQSQPAWAEALALEGMGKGQHQAARAGKRAAVGIVKPELRVLAETQAAAGQPDAPAAALLDSLLISGAKTLAVVEPAEHA
jgi:hypothetical protein